MEKISDTSGCENPLPGSGSLAVCLKDVRQKTLNSSPANTAEILVLRQAGVWAFQFGGLDRNTPVLSTTWEDEAGIMQIQGQPGLMCGIELQIKEDRARM